MAKKKSGGVVFETQGGGPDDPRWESNGGRWKDSSSKLGAAIGEALNPGSTFWRRDKNGDVINQGGNRKFVGIKDMFFRRGA